MAQEKRIQIFEIIRTLCNIYYKRYVLQKQLPFFAYKDKTKNRKGIDLMKTKEEAKALAMNHAELSDDDPEQVSGGVESVCGSRDSRSIKPGYYAEMLKES